MLGMRLAVGSVIIVLVCCAFVADYVTAQPLILTILIAVLAALGAHELCSMARRTGKKPFTWLAVLGSAGFAGAAFLGGGGRWGEAELLGIVLAAFLGATLIAQRLRGALQGALVNAGATIFTALYVGFLLSFLVRIRLLPSAGLAGVVLVVFGAKVSDIAAYFIGSSLGKRKLAPVVSPNKTIAGAVAGLVASIVVGMIVCHVAGLLGFWRALGVCVLIGVFSQIGDLSESILKRDLDAKDASASVPGFGGVLDLLDSLLFSAPVAYVVLRALAP